MPAMIKELRDQNLSKGWRGRDSYLNKMKAPTSQWRSLHGGPHHGFSQGRRLKKKKKKKKKKQHVNIDLWEKPVAEVIWRGGQWHMTLSTTKDRKKDERESSLVMVGQLQRDQRA
ncbi:hypothetical protein C4D60_Mb09t25240 [Musa balbisiana]|uniref:Uncharacterized protein n=1 Tax=Musa balbisiana TaxID=52838 RepID=A0A4S8IKC2_MUSBA|nr:hypothetical protein C4D60_Mb09t25240 [Musa balbisiana]